jgi:hypothetical protein
MVRRRCFEVAGLWDEALRGGEDRDLWLRLTLRCRFSFVPEPLVRIDRMRDDRATVDWLRMARNREAYLKKWERELPVRFSPHLSALRRQSYDYIAKCHYRLENFRLARSYSLRAAFAGRRIDEPCRESFRLFAKSFVRSVRRQVRLDHTR